MNLVLHIYEDENLSKVKREATADKLKIPYRVAMSLISLLDNTDINSEKDLIKLVSSMPDKLDKIIKATFDVTEAELECVDAAELVAVAKDLYGWAMDKITGIKGGNDSKNALTAAEKI